jgi:hypothetical protein
VSEITVQRKVGLFGPKCDEVTGICRQLRTEVFHNVYSSYIMGINPVWTGDVTRIRETITAYTIIVGKPGRKR